MAASGATNLADGLLQVALPLLALQLTRSPLLVAGLTVASRLPWLLFALVAGVVADRVDRRQLMLAVEVFRTAALGIAAGMAMLDVLMLWHLYLLAMSLGVSETLFDTAAQSVLPGVVGKDQLHQANSRLYGVEVTTNNFVGPPLGGLLAGTAPTIALAAASLNHAIAVIFLTTVTGSFRPHRHTSRSSVRVDLLEGVSHLWRHALLRRLALLVGGISLALAATFAVLPVYVVAPGPMGLNEAQYGLFLTSAGVGAVLGSMTAERMVQRVGSATSLRAAVIAIAAMLASPILAQPIAVAVALALGGYLTVLWNVVTVSLRQRIVPDHLLGRVNSCYRLLAWGGGPVGAIVGGLIAEATDLRVTFAAAALGTLALLVAMRPLTNQTLSHDH